MNIRPASSADTVSLIALWQRCALIRPWNDPRLDIARTAAARNSDILVGTIDGMIVASAMVGHDGHRGWVYYVAVDPGYRGRGLGRQIMAAAETWVFQRGMPKVQLMVRANNEKILNFYRAVGYADNPTIVLDKWHDPDARASTRPRLTITITSLEIAASSTRKQPPHPTEPVHFLRVRRPDIGFYRFLYSQIGGPWCWYERMLLSDPELAAVLTAPERELYVLYGDGAPAGLAELERRPDQVQLCYFGLDRGWLGRGVGRHLMAATLDAAFLPGTPKVTANTCTLDHPRALAFYQRCGFTAVGQARSEIDDPRAIGAAPADASPHVPPAR